MTDRRSRTTRMQLALLVGLALAAAGIKAATARAPAPAQNEANPASPSFTPTDTIDVERAVDFPYDI